MTELLLIRHGQGGATPETYDDLSALGHRQARRLGEWLLADGRLPQALAVGQMRRQQLTLEGVRAVYAEAGQPLPAAVVLPGLDEYRFADLVRAFAQTQPAHPELRLVRERPTDKRLWIGLLRTTLQAWADDTLPEVPERYAEFQARSRAAMAQLQDWAARGSVLAVSSGGVMSQFAQAALGFPDGAAIDVNLALLNTAVCEYRLTRSGLKLQSLNALPHLAEPAHRELISLV